MKTKPCVSVIMITYNQENFISQAIAGVLNQHCSFDVELIIANDNSSDRTDNVVLNSINKLPKHIVVNYINRKSNLGGNPNFIDALNKASGEYIAMCEGDDYWTDPLKLEKQVNYLTKNADCNLVYHRVMLYDEDSKIFTKENLNKEEFTLKRDLETLTLDGNFMHTPSVVFRNNIDFDSPLFRGVVGDYILWYLNGEKGLFGYIPDYMAVYRIWNGGVWSKRRKATAHYIFAKLLIRMSESVNTPLISSNLRKQSVNTLLRVGFSELTINEKFKYCYLVLKYSDAPIDLLFKKIRLKLANLKKS